MTVSETCACGASFSADGDGVARLLKEWRATHTCPDKSTEITDLVFTESSAQVEQVLGFQVAGLTVPGRDDPALDE